MPRSTLPRPIPPRLACRILIAVKNVALFPSFAVCIMPQKKKKKKIWRSLVLIAPPVCSRLYFFGVTGWHRCHCLTTYFCYIQMLSDDFPGAVCLISHPSWTHFGLLTMMWGIICECADDVHSLPSSLKKLFAKPVNLQCAVGDWHDTSTPNCQTIKLWC